MRVVLFCLLSILSLVCRASILPSGAFVITQAAWQTHNSQYLTKPASLMKLLTATAAWDQLGPSFEFHTILNVRKVAPHEADVLLTFQGDPTLQLDDLLALLSHLKAAGIRKISHFSIDDSAYSGHPWGVGQVWNDHGICFAAPTSAIIVNQNCVLGNLKATTPGQKAKLHLNRYAGFEVDNEVVTQDLPKDQCEPLLTARSDNHYLLSGCLSTQQKYLPMAFSVIDEHRYIQAILTRALKDLGVDWSKQLDYHAKWDHVDQQWVHSSKPLKVLLKKMLKHSDNVIADSLFKRLGAHYSQHSGSFTSGEKGLWQSLEKLGITKQNQVVRDGSGLSRENLLYAATLYNVLLLWRDNPKFRPLIDDLPISGIDGTLKYRRSLFHKPFYRHVLAKTGSMSGVANLAGYIKVKGKLKPFVLMANQLASLDESQSSTKALGSYEQQFLLKGFNNR